MATWNAKGECKKERKYSVNLDEGSSPRLQEDFMNIEMEGKLKEHRRVFSPFQVGFFLSHFCTFFSSRDKELRKHGRSSVIHSCAFAGFVPPMLFETTRPEIDTARRARGRKTFVSFLPLTSSVNEEWSDTFYFFAFRHRIQQSEFPAHFCHEDAMVTALSPHFHPHVLRAEKNACNSQIDPMIGWEKKKKKKRERWARGSLTQFSAHYQITTST